MLYYNLLFLLQIQAQKIISTVVDTVVILGVFFSIAGVIYSIRKFKRDHHNEMATKEDVKLAENRLKKQIKTVDEKLEDHKLEEQRLQAEKEKRFNDMYDMVKVIYSKYQ